MSTKKQIKRFLILAIPFFLLIHFLGWWKLYYELQFYDEIVHFLAGASVFWVLFNYFKIIGCQKNKVALSLISLVLITFLWELSEFFLDNLLKDYFIMPLRLGLLDTISDCIANFAGAFFVIIWLQLKNKV